MLYLVVTEFSIISTLNGVVLWDWSGMMMTPSARCSSSRVCDVLLVVVVGFMGLSYIVSALAKLASSSTTMSPSSIRVRIEHVSFLYIAPRLEVIFFD